MNSVLLIKSAFFYIAVYGLTFGLVYSRGLFGIFNGFRKVLFFISKEFEQMLECPYCTSCNIGMIASLVDLFLLKSIEITPGNMLCDSNSSFWYYILFIDIFSTSAIVYLIDTIQNRIEKNG